MHHAPHMCHGVWVRVCTMLPACVMAFFTAMQDLQPDANISPLSRNLDPWFQIGSWDPNFDLTEQIRFTNIS